MLDGFIDRTLTAQRAAQSLGIANETFIGMEKVARKAGVETEGLTTALRHGAKAVSEAAAGSGAAQDAFRMLGLSASELKGMSVDEQFNKIGASISALQNPADRVQASIAIFGRQGASLIPMFQQGGEAVKKAADEAKRLGIALSDADIAKLKDLKLISFGKVKEQIEALVAKIAIALSPVIKIISDIFQQAVSVVVPIINSIAGIISKIADRVGPIIKKIGDFIVKGFQTAMTLIQPILEFVGEWITVAAELWEEIFEGFIAIVQPIWEGLGEVLSSIVEFLKPVTDALGLTGGAFRSFRDIVIDIFQGVVGALTYFVDAAKMVAGFVITYMVTPLIMGFRMLLQAASSIVGALARIPIVGRAFRVAAQGLDTFAQSVRRTEDSMRNTGRNLMATNFGDTRRTTDQFFDNLRNRNRQVTAEVAANNPITAIDAALMASIAKLEEELQKSIATFGMSSEEIKRWELVQRGASDADLARVDALTRQKAAMDAMVKTIEEGKKLTEELASPQEKFESEMEKLNNLLEEGVISWETYARGAEKALKNIAGAIKEELKVPSIQISGSAAAISTINRNAMLQQGGGREQTMQRLAEQQRDLTAQSVQIARATLTAIQNQPVPQAA